MSESNTDEIVLHHTPTQEPEEQDDMEERARIGRLRSRVQLIALGLLVLVVSYDSCKDCKSCKCSAPAKKDPDDQRDHIPPNLPPVPQGSSMSPAQMRAPMHDDTPWWLQVPNLPSKPEKAGSLNLDVKSHEEVFDAIKQGVKSQGVLVVAYNNAELDRDYQMFGRTLRRRVKQQPDYPAKFERGPATGVGKMVVNTVDERNRKIKVPIYFMTAGTLQSREGKQFLEGKQFSYVQLRGHHSRRYNIDQMTPLLNLVKPYRNPSASLVAMGGCKASVFQDSICTPQTPLLAQNEVGYTERNNYLLLRSIDEIMGQNTWGSMYRAIAEESPVARNGVQDYIPGQTGYGRGCPGWNQFPNRVSGRSVSRKVASLRQNRDKWKAWRTQVRRMKQETQDQRKIAYLDRQIAEANEQVRQFAVQIEAWKKQKPSRRRPRRTVSIFKDEAAPRRRRRSRRRRSGRRRRR